MSTFPAQSAELSKNRGRAISVLSLVILFWLLAACTGNGPPTEFSMIEAPSAIRHIIWGSYSHPDNLANYQVGAVSDGGEIIEITGLDGGVMWSYPLGDQMFMRDLKGIAVTIDLDDQWGSGMLGDNFHEMGSHLLVLEFRFPEATFPSQAEINWFVEPHLICRYEIESTDSSNEASVWFEYLVYEDPLGAVDLVRGGDAHALWEILSQGLEDEKEYIFEGDVNGTLVASSDERSGTMVVGPGMSPRLFVGVSVQMRTHQQGDRIRLGGDSLPNSVSDSDRCTFNFGTNSYYTIVTQ